MRSKAAIAIASLLSIACSPSHLATAKAYGLSEQDCKIVDNALESSKANPCFSKGGVGLVRNDLYVVTKSDINQLILPGNKKWSGAKRSVLQLVFISDNAIINEFTSLKSISLKATTAILFQKDSILFYEFKHSEGGSYARIDK